MVEMSIRRGASPLLPCRGEFEEERRMGPWATSGYPYTHQQAQETALRTYTEEAMEVNALAFAAGNGGVKRKREKGDVGEGFTV